MVSSSRFVITRGVENVFVFTIKEEGSTLPKDITGWVFTGNLYKLSDSASVPTAVSIGSGVLETPTTSGRVRFTVTSSVANSLEIDKGGKVDRFYVRPTYKLMIIGTKSGQPNIVAKVEEVYVD
jgi:hypothetical protein